MRGEVLWQDFGMAFRLQTIHSWTRPTVIDWRDILTQRGVCVDPDRTRPPNDVIVQLLFRPAHIGRNLEKNVTHPDITLHHHEQQDQQRDAVARPGQTVLPITDTEGDQEADDQDGPHHNPSPNATKSGKTAASGHPDAGDSSSDPD